ncbi:MAG TPA: hypothetical protein VEH29_11295 [Acidimicrobiales bacterium]|nr:hypothetical protein [Acidimicrobiales bacterium]
MPKAKVHHRPTLSLTLDRSVCEQCNNEFLAGLERAIQPLLEPMMLRHESTTLELSDQGLLATWAVKTVYLLELAFRQHYPRARPIPGYVASDVELAWLRERREPPPRARVWLGCFDAMKTTAVMYEPSEAPVPVVPRGEPVIGHLTSFSLGYVALQVFSIDFVRADSAGAVQFQPPDPPPRLRGAVLPLWPTRLRRLPWPPPAFPHDDWNMFVTWGGSLR